MVRLNLSAKYLGYIQNPQTNHKVIQAKRYFLLEIKKERYYKNKRVVYAKANISDEECWIKFMFGSEKFHSGTTKIDLNRVSRSHWMFNIIDYLNKTPPTEYDTSISFECETSSREIINISLKNETYKIIVQYLKDGTVMVITAFSKKKIEVHV